MRVIGDVSADRVAGMRIAQSGVVQTSQCFRRKSLGPAHFTYILCKAGEDNRNVEC